MDRTIATGTVPAGDSPPLSGTPQFVTDGDPGAGISATEIPAYQWNAFQEEICGAILASGQTLDRNNNNQLMLAIQNGARFFTNRAGTNYTYTAADKSFASIRSNSGAPMIDTLPGPGTGVMPSYWSTVIKNGDPTALLAIKVADGANLDNVAHGVIYLGPGQSCNVQSDGTNYYTLYKPLLAKLSQNTALYVNASAGNDNNSGVSSIDAFQTIQAAFNAAMGNLHLNSYVLTIQLADGTYTTGLIATGVMAGAINQSSIVFNGNAVTPANVVIFTTNAHNFSAAHGLSLTIQNMKLKTASQGHCLLARTSAVFRFINVIFDTCAQSHIYADVGGEILAEGAYSITGAAHCHIQLERTGIFYADTATPVTLSGAPAFSNAFASATQTSSLDASNMSFTGSATGQRYSATKNALIDTGGGGSTFFPGNINGSTGTGGLYT